jgi:hypothetical protein
MDIDREALEGIFGFFQVAYNSMVYFANFQHILFFSKLTFLHNNTSSSHFAIRGGAKGRSHEGWMGPIPMGTHIVYVSRHVLPYVVVQHESHVRD